MSRTDQIQQHIDEQLTWMLVKARNAEEFSGAAEKVRASLADPNTLSTPDFVLRRHIFKTQHWLLEKWPELTDNAPWDISISNHVAKTLAQADNGISQKVWRSYFTGNARPDTREKVMRLAVLMGMDLDTVQALLMSLEMPTLNMRFPMDFLCYPAFRNPGTITWAQIQAGLADFRAKHEGDILPVTELRVGETQMLEAAIEKMISDGQNVAEKLTQYMDANAEFFLDTEQKALAAYSKTTQAKFLHLSKMLAVLYPYYHDKVNNKSAIHMGNFQRVESDEEGLPHLQELGKAMLFLNGWRQIWAPLSKQEIKEMDQLEEYFYRFQDTYSDHLTKVDNAIHGTGGKHAFFTRNDALLFAYFFIQGYRNVCDGIDTTFRTEDEYFVDPDPDDPAWNNAIIEAFKERYQQKAAAQNAFFAAIASADQQKAQLDSLLGNADDMTLQNFDDCLAEVMDRWDRFSPEKDEADPKEMYTETLNALDLILEALGQRKIYILNRMDRLILLALLSDSPTELLPLIMSVKSKSLYDQANAQHKVRKETQKHTKT